VHLKGKVTWSWSWVTEKMMTVLVKKEIDESMFQNFQNFVYIKSGLHWLFVHCSKANAKSGKGEAMIGCRTCCWPEPQKIE